MAYTPRSRVGKYLVSDSVEGSGTRLLLAGLEDSVLTERILATRLEQKAFRGAVEFEVVHEGMRLLFTQKTAGGTILYVRETT